jgi:hypothetical protein
MPESFENPTTPQNEEEDSLEKVEEKVEETEKITEVEERPELKNFTQEEIDEAIEKIAVVGDMQHLPPDTLTKIDSENIDSILDLGAEKIGKDRQEVNKDSFKNLEEGVEELWNRSSSAHALLCSVNGKEDFRAFKGTLERFADEKKVQETDERITYLAETTDRQIKIEEVSEELFKIDLKKTIGDIKKDESFFENSVSQIENLAPKIEGVLDYFKKEEVQSRSKEIKSKSGTDIKDFTEKLEENLNLIKDGKTKLIKDKFYDFCLGIGRLRWLDFEVLNAEKMGKTAKELVNSYKSFEGPSILPNEEKKSGKEETEEEAQDKPQEAGKESQEEVKERIEEKSPKKEVSEEGEEKTKEELGRIEEEIKTMQEQTLEEKTAVEEKRQKEERRELVKEVVEEELPEKFKDLIGDNSEEAWEKRKELFEKDPAYTAASLAGTNSEKGRTWLEANKDSQKMWWGISRGLIGDDSEEAWKLREHLKVDERVDKVRGGRLAEVKKTLGLHKSERIFNLRSKAKQLLGWYEPGDVVISTTGLDSEEAWKLREEMEDIAPAEVLISLAGVNSEKAQELREKYKGDKKLEWALQRSLASVEIEEEKQEQKQESKNISPEEEAFPDKKMSPEDFKEMIDQIPALKEMLREREERLKFLIESKEQTEETKEEIENFTIEIAELKEEISNRESLL